MTHKISHPTFSNQKRTVLFKDAYLEILLHTTPHCVLKFSCDLPKTVFLNLGDGASHGVAWNSNRVG